MADIVEMIKNKEDVFIGSGVSNEKIKLAEQELGIKFSEEYKEYLKKIGLAAFDGRELTGLGKIKRTNVVTVTKELWNKSDKIPHSMYVLEETGIDGIIYLQDTSGVIYQLVFGDKPIKTTESFTSFIGE